MVNTQAMPKLASNQYFLGELAALSNLSTTVRTSVAYAILGLPTRRKVFIEVHGVLKKLLEKQHSCNEMEETELRLL